jgi:alpha-ribazole phosphatase/probable phosphoglycerate mutase
MSEILFIRHAETDMAGTFCGQSDPELNAKGLSQLATLLREIRAAEIGAVYTSDLRRSRATANAIAEALGVECHASAALREINFGQWEGLRWDEIERRDETYARKWALEYPYLPARNGENFRDFKRRVLNEVNFLSTEVERRNCSIAVITHAGVLRTILTTLQGCSEEYAHEATKSYCSIVRYNATTSFGSQNFATANEDR